MAARIKHALEDLTGFVPRHDSFVGIDSDGCVFDTMEIKQKQCFHGLIVSHWQLHTIEKAVREAAEFVNLYSKWRGQNRFLALLKVFDLLPAHPAVRASGVPTPHLESLRRFIESGAMLSESALRRETDATHDPELLKLLAWSQDVNAAIANTVKCIPPFRWARKSLELLQGRSDAMCVSQTPAEALVREWEENGIEGFITMIAGQELGTKAEHLAIATSGKYRPDRVLMIGDALGDHRAANANNALFFPINPAHEEASWQRFHDEAYARFLDGTFAGSYQDGLVQQFEALLPEHAPWER
jgi:phosphoglycolate phosphatase-like HAD superfamily hydrolase